MTYRRIVEIEDMLADALERDGFSVVSHDGERRLFAPPMSGEMDGCEPPSLSLREVAVDLERMLS